MKNRGLVVMLVSSGAAALFAVALLRSPAYVAASPLEFDQMAAALAYHGTELTALSAGRTIPSLVPSAVSATVAVDLAVATFGKANTPVVFEGLLTLQDHSPSVDERLVYAVQLTGLNLPPFGGRGPVTDAMMHHEMIVFIDAESGAYLLASTVR